MNNVQAIVNYCLNRFCPMLMLGFLIFMNFELTQWEPYVIIALMIFMDRYQFKVGYSVGYCEAHGIDPTDPRTSTKPFPPRRKKNIQKTKDSVDDRE